MSSSSLWGLTNEFKGVELEEYRNSWLVTPIAWDILYLKYLPLEGWYELGNQRHRKTFISALDDNTLWNRLNELINNCGNETDRAVWEFCAQQVFYSKDKAYMAEHLKKFLEQNEQYRQTEYGKHLFERWDKVAEDILAIDEEEYPFFIFKNTSVDDEVEHWFQNHDAENEDDQYDRPLSEKKEYVCEFVNIQDGKMVGWENNLEFFKRLESHLNIESDFE